MGRKSGAVSAQATRKAIRKLEQLDVAEIGRGHGYAAFQSAA